MPAPSLQLKCSSYIFSSHYVSFYFVIKIKGTRFQLVIFKGRIHSNLASKQISPRLQPFTFGDHVNVGQRVSVYCSLLQGTSPVKLSWSHQGQPISSTLTVHRVRVHNPTEDSSILTLNEVTLEDAGNYACIAENSFGKHQQESRLNVKGT